MTDIKLMLTKHAKGTILAFTLFQGLSFYLLDYFKDQLSDLLFQVIIIAVITVPIFIIFSVLDIRHKKWWGIVSIYALTVVSTAYYTAYQCTGDETLSCSSEHWFQYAAPQIIAWFIILFFTQVWLKNKDFSFPYSDLIRASWSNYITLKLSLLFLLIFSGLLALWASLFNMIGIEIFKHIFVQPWFMFPVGGLMLGFGVINFRQRIHTVDLVLNILQVLMHWLLPVVSLMSILFLVTLPFTGLEGLWNTGYATSIMLWLVSLLLFFSNAVYLLGDNESQHSKSYNLLIKTSLLLSPIYIWLSAQGLLIRVNDYGWTVGRLWVLIIILLLAAFTLSYSYSLIRRRDNWFYHITRINRLLAVCIAIVSLLVTSPIIDLRKISVQSQLARLETGQVSIENFDYRYLRFKTGRAGHQALLDLQQNPEIENNNEISSHIESVLKAKNKWHVVRKALKNNTESFIKVVKIYPQGTQIPDELLSVLLKNKSTIKLCKRIKTCFIFKVDVHGDETEEYLLNHAHRYFDHARVFGLINNKWQQIGTSNISKTVDVKIAQDYLNNNEYETSASSWKSLIIDGKTVEFRQ